MNWKQQNMIPFRAVFSYVVYFCSQIKKNSIHAFLHIIRLLYTLHMTKSREYEIVPFQSYWTFSPDKLFLHFNFFSAYS